MTLLSVFLFIGYPGFIKLFALGKIDKVRGCSLKGMSVCV